MNTRRFGAALCAISVAFVLAGCGDDKPSDKVTAETLRPIAETDLHEGLEIANFQRKNGLVDPDSANRYKVTYSYDLRLAKPYAEVVLANAKALQNSWIINAKRETGAFFDMAALQNSVEGMQLNMTIGQWVKGQGDSYKARRDLVIGHCSPCVAYWNSEDAPKEADTRRRAFLASWMFFEELGYKDEAKVGDSVPRQVWASFSKTEKGWQKTE